MHSNKPLFWSEIASSYDGGSDEVFEVCATLLLIFVFSAGTCVKIIGAPCRCGEEAFGLEATLKT